MILQPGDLALITTIPAWCLEKLPTPVAAAGWVILRKVECVLVLSRYKDVENVFTVMRQNGQRLYSVVGHVMQKLA